MDRFKTEKKPVRPAHRRVNSDTKNLIKPKQKDFPTINPENIPKVGAKYVSLHKYGGD